MASLTIHDLEAPLRDRLRARATLRGRSMEEEARHILQNALEPEGIVAGNLADAIQRRFAPLGGVALQSVPREMGPPPPDFT